jgi:hypothetical protein
MRRETKPQPRRNEATQNQLIKEQQTSGLSVKDFCERHQLQVSIFHKYLGKSYSVYDPKLATISNNIVLSFSIVR